MSQEHIGKYRVLAKLGQGGMARVLLTMSQGMAGFNKLLVVKELREELAHDPEFLAMFMDEARIAARLNHPNIVQTYEVGSDGERYFIAMEYLEGQPLNAVFRRLGRKNIPLELHLRMLADVLSGLEHAHKLTDFDGSPLTVVHRDVSPQNVFVTYEGQVKLVDFGIAKAAGASSRTQEGMLKGKISYIAPEQARCESVDARADLFTVGVMLWEALAGRRMVTREDEMSVLARRMAGQDPLVREAAPEVPDDLAAICNKAMAPKKEDRFQSAREFQEVLEAYLAGSDFRVTAKDVGALVSNAFEDEKVRIKATIEEQVRNVDRFVEPINLELVPASLKATSDSLARVVLPARHPSETPATGSSIAQAMAMGQLQAPPPRSRSSMLSALAAGTVLALAALAIVLYVSFRKDPTKDGAAGQPPPSTTTATSTASVAETKTSATSSSAAAPAASGSVLMSELVVTYPEGARVKLDGGYVEGNPFTARVPRDGSLHKIEVEQEGHKKEVRTVTFDKESIPVKVELNPLPGRPYIPRPSKSQAVVETAAPPPTQPKPTAEEGPKKPPGTQPTVELIETNPYNKKPKP